MRTGMKACNKIKKYKIASHLIFIFVATYIAIGCFIIENDYPIKKMEVSKFLTGKLELSVYGDILSFTLSTDVKRIKFHFINKINEIGVISEKYPDYNVRVSSNKKWLFITANKGDLLNKKINISLSGIKYSGMPITRNIDKVFVGDNQISIYDFYFNKLNIKSSNITTYYPLSINNISNFMARKFGTIVIVLVKSILIILFMSQLALFFILVFWNVPVANDFFKNPENKFPLTFIDNISENFSIYLGFLGTITSLWLSLEIATINFQSFGDVLSVMKNGIFTTVLGLSIRVLCTARGLFRTISEGN
jgi:hypothetical protein